MIYRGDLVTLVAYRGEPCATRYNTSRHATRKGAGLILGHAAADQHHCRVDVITMSRGPGNMLVVRYPCLRARRGT